MDSVLKYFDLATMRWRTKRTASSISVPTLNGHLSGNLSDRQAASTDWGHIVCEPPSTVLYPASITDIAKMVRFCGLLGIRIGARGQAHTMYGQSQVGKGVIIHMASLNRINSIEPDHALVEAGVIWRDLLAATIAKGLTPPVLTDYLSLSIGGTLSVGGVNGTSYNHGAQVDNVISLDVVTGAGDLVTCSLESNRDLFESTLAGLGQCAIIVRAKLKLIPAPRFIRAYDIAYQHLDSFLLDFQKILMGERFDYVQGVVTASPTKNRRKYILEAVSFYDEKPPDNDTLLCGLQFVSRGLQTIEDTYLGFCDRVSQKETSLRQSDRWNLPHPWFDMFIPVSQAAAYIDIVLSKLGCDDHSDFANLLYGFRKKCSNTAIAARS